MSDDEISDGTPDGRPAAYDVVVVGGGAAGLSGALVLARAGRSVLVVDDGRPRNAPAAGVHNYLGREGTPPAELYAIGRAEVATYGGRFCEGRVVEARRLDNGGFAVRRADGLTVHARRLLVTTGLVDELPPVPGLAARWGREVLHCPYCHGAEVRGRRIGVIATGPHAVDQALLWRQWSPDVVLFLHTAGEPGPTEREQLDARDVVLVEGEVAGLDDDADGRLAGVRLADGSVVPRDALVVAPRFAARGELLEGLGLSAEPFEMRGTVIGTTVPSQAWGTTTVPGVYLAGNVTDPMVQVVTAAAAGLTAAAAINGDLVAEDTRRAVAARRAAAGRQEPDAATASSPAVARALPAG